LPRTEREPRGRFLPRRAASFARRLDVRMVAALAGVALIGLLASGVALTQFLPVYFTRQAESQLRSAVLAAGSLAKIAMEEDPVAATVRERREPELLQPAAEQAASVLGATVEFRNPDGSRAAYGVPSNDRELRDQGLRPDAGVAAQSVTQEVQLPRAELPLTGPSGLLNLQIIASEPYTRRIETLQQVNGTLVVAGVMALLVSIIVGTLAARRLARPIRRLQTAASRISAGDLGERVPPSGIEELDDLGSQFNVMGDRLGKTLALLQADRDRLREFVADVSHELRTPIAALRTFTELQREGEVDEATRREFLDRSAEQISRLEWLSTNLLDLSRIDSGIFPLAIAEGDLRDPVRAVVEAHAEVAEERGVSLWSEVPSEPVAMRFDRERIVQCVTNLVGNALKFTPRGGEVGVRITVQPDASVVEVSDTGPGIPAAELPRVFDRFFRGTNVGEARASGSGLGLAITRSIAEMHGGSIEVESAVGAGTRFRVHLPRNGPPEPDEVRADGEIGRAAAREGQ
jgi:signal transduction histidine kinase